jgi:hypothetical protein
MSERIQNLQDAAPVLDALIAQPDAHVFFEVMSGALVWSDEYPFVADGVYYDIEMFPRQLLRGVWAYRSSLIEGEPKERCRAGWELAQSLFPKWPGFLPERRDPSLKDLLVRLREEAGDPFEDLEKRWQAQQTARGAGAVKAS